MTQKQRAILKQYIKESINEILSESEVLDISVPGDTALSAEMAKGINKPYPIGPQEVAKIKEAIHFRYPSIHTVDFKNNTIEFDKQGSPNNFHIVIRKIANAQNSGQYKYVMWYIPFVEREDIDKPGAIHKKESNPFDRNMSIPVLLSDIYEFFTQALLINL